MHWSSARDGALREIVWGLRVAMSDSPSGNTIPSISLRAVRMMPARRPDRTVGVQLNFANGIEEPVGMFQPNVIVALPVEDVVRGRAGNQRRSGHRDSAQHADGFVARVRDEGPGAKVATAGGTRRPWSSLAPWSG